MLDVLFGCFFFQAEDGIRDLVRSRGLGDVYKRQAFFRVNQPLRGRNAEHDRRVLRWQFHERVEHLLHCLLYTSDAADERSSVDLGGRRIIKKKNDTEVPLQCVDDCKTKKI